MLILLQNLTFAQCLSAYQDDGGVNLPDGSIYYGKIKNNKFNDTQGFLNWINGAAYVGGFKDGLMSGVGKMKFANGSEYKGQFKNGMANGLGFLHFANGDKYEGSFKDDLVHGYGVMNFSNGSKYEGYFKNDLFHGIGDLKYGGLGGGYYGSFKKDAFHGEGTLYFDFGDIVSFKGDFINNEPKVGTLIFINGDIYNGEVNNELFPHGKGEYIFKGKNKISKNGVFENGKYKKSKESEWTAPKKLDTHL